MAALHFDDGLVVESRLVVYTDSHTGGPHSPGPRISGQQTPVIVPGQRQETETEELQVCHSWLGFGCVQGRNRYACRVAVGDWTVTPVTLETKYSSSPEQTEVKLQ